MGCEHNGHRARMRARAKKSELAGFEPHEVLELILFGSRARGNVNPLAHALVRRFGSVSAALSAAEEALAQVPGVGRQTVEYLSAANALLLALRKKAPARLTLSNPATAKAYIRVCLADITARGVWQFNLDVSFGLVRAEQIVEEAESLSLTDLAARVLASAVACGACSVLLVYHLPKEPSALITLRQAQTLSRQLSHARIRLFDMYVHDGSRLYSARDHMLLSDSEYKTSAAAVREKPPEPE